MAGDDRAGLRAVGGLESAGKTSGAAAEPTFTAAEGRKFGLTVGCAFMVVAGILAWRGHVPVSLAFAALGVSLVLGGFALPDRLGPVYRAWMAGARAISRVTTPVVLGVVYFLVLTPTGVLRRILGGDPLRHPESGNSYWARRQDEGRSDLERQF